MKNTYCMQKLYEKSYKQILQSQNTQIIYPNNKLHCQYIHTHFQIYLTKTDRNKNHSLLLSIIMPRPFAPSSHVALPPKRNQSAIIHVWQQVIQWVESVVVSLQ